MEDGDLPDQHLQPGTSNSAERKLGLDDMPTEIIELICSLILRPRESRPERQVWHRLHKFPLDGRPCTQSIANLVAASRRYRDIALPFLYSRWACHSNKMGRPIDFVRTLCDNPVLGLLVKEVVFQSGPTDIGDTPSLTSEEDGIFHDTALRLLPSLYPLDPIDKGDYNIRPWVNRQLLPLVFLLAPNLKRLSICVTHKDLGAITGSDKHPLPPLLTSVEHIEIFNLGSAWDAHYGLPTIPRGEGSTIIRPLILMSPALKTLTIRHTCLLGRKPEFKFNLDFLIELHLRDVLISGRSLKWILRACKALEVFSVHCFPYRGDWSQPDVSFWAPDLLPALSHLKGSLRRLAVNRWENRKREMRLGEEVGEFEPSGGSAAYPDGIGDLRDFTKLETLKLDPTNYSYPSVGKQASVPPPRDHLVKRLPSSLRHLVLPGAPGSLEPALYEVAAHAAAGEFPRLETVVMTFDEDRRMWEEPWKRWEWDGKVDEEPRPDHFLHPASTGLFTTFLGQERRRTLEEAFGSAGVALKHIDSGQVGWSWKPDC